MNGIWLRGGAPFGGHEDGVNIGIGMRTRIDAVALQGGKSAQAVLNIIEAKESTRIDFLEP